MSKKETTARRGRDVSGRAFHHVGDVPTAQDGGEAPVAGPTQQGPTSSQGGSGEGGGESGGGGSDQSGKDE